MCACLCVYAVWRSRFFVAGLESRFWPGGAVRACPGVSGCLRFLFHFFFFFPSLLILPSLWGLLAPVSLFPRRQVRLSSPPRLPSPPRLRTYLPLRRVVILPRFRDVMSAGVMSTELVLLGERQDGRLGCGPIVALEGPGQGQKFLRRCHRFQEKRRRHGKGERGGVEGWMRCSSLVG